MAIAARRRTAGLKSDFAKFEGIEEAIKVLDNIQDNLTRKDFNSIARKSLKDTVKDARSELYKISDGRSSSRSGISKAYFVARSVKVATNNKVTQPYGAKVWVDGDDITVGSRKWTLRGYAKLLASGNYRKSRNTRSSGARRGDFSGFGNYILRAAQRNRARASVRFEQLAIKKMEEVAQRAQNKYA